MAEHNLLKASDRQHLMLLYDEEAARNEAEIGCINEALGMDQVCIYATVDIDNKEFVEKLPSKIIDYDRHVQDGNLILLNFMPFYEAAANSDVRLFDGLKDQVEATLLNRSSAGKRSKALIVADAACNLTRHQQLDECIALESWWQETYVEWSRKNLDITIICAHPSSVLKHDIQSRSHISGKHSLTIDLREFVKSPASKRIYKQSEARPIRVLIAEHEQDLQTLYRKYLGSLPIEIVEVPDGKQCLEHALMSGDFDVIIVDSHLKDIGGIEIAKKILEEKPRQRVILTTTRDPSAILPHLKSDFFEMDPAQILVKPFKFSQLLSLIRPAESRIS